MKLEDADLLEWVKDSRQNVYDEKVGEDKDYT